MKLKLFRKNEIFSIILVAFVEINKERCLIRFVRDSTFPREEIVFPLNLYKKILLDEEVIYEDEIENN